MDGMFGGMLSEELLKASLLVPKRKKVDVEGSSSDDGGRLPIEVTNVPSTIHLSYDLSKIQLLQERYEEAKIRYEECMMAASQAFEKMTSAFTELTHTVNPNLAASTTFLNTTNLTRNFPAQRNIAVHDVVPTAIVTPENSELSMEDSHQQDLKEIVLLTNTTVTSKNKFLPRKPRSLLFNRKHPDLMLTSTLDGSIQPWTVARKAIAMQSLHLPSLLDESCFAEDMCFDGSGDCLAVVLSESRTTDDDTPNDTISPLKTNLVIIPLAADGSLNSPVSMKPTFPVHSKYISSVVSYYDGPSDHSYFLTGGNDRALVLWNVSLEDGKPKLNDAQEIHRRHTSAVHSICQQVQSRNVWSGGPDMRLVGYNLSKTQPVLEHKLDARISHILANQNQPNSLLVMQTKQNEQFKMIDVRSPTTSCPTFGWLETTNTSRYLRPSWHPSGNIIVVGSSNPASRSSGINIWDIRYISNATSPLQTIEMLSDRRYWTTDFHPSQDLLVSLATDGSVSFLEYRLA